MCEKLLRKTLKKNLQEFRHGGDVEAFAKEHGLKKREVIDLSSNINFIQPKFKTKGDLSSYPKYGKLLKSIKKRYGVKKSQVELFNGGSSAIFSFFRNCRFKRVTIYSPAYLEYKKAAKVFGKNVEHINRFENIYKKPKKNSLVIFVNPSTPDGAYYDLKRLFKIWKKANATVFIDESFLDFTEKESAVKCLKKYKKLYILKSLTKFYSAAGRRLGILISNRKNIEKIKYKEPLWKISASDSLYFAQVLNQHYFIEKTIKKTAKNRERLKKILVGSKYIGQIWDSTANYILAKLERIKAKEFLKRAATEKIMIRECSNFDFLDDSYVRIAVKRKQDIKALKKIL